MMGSIAGMYAARFYTPIAISLFGRLTVSKALSEARKHQPHVILLDRGLPG